MKKLFVTLLTSVFAVLTGQAQVFTVDGLTYVITNAQAKTVSVTYFNGKGTDGNAGYTGPVVIPQNVTNEDVTYEVTGIGNSAFAYSEITSVTIPASVTSVGNTAFYGSHLTSITIADSDQPLEWPNGFYDGPMREISDSYSVYLGRDLSYSDTGRSPFVNATSVTFGQNVTTINKCMFYGAKNLTDVVISNGVTTIGDEAFRNAGSNEDVAEMKVTMGENVTEIGPAAFYNATHLKALTLPAGLKVVSNEVLAYTAVNSVTIPAAVDSISRIPFYGAPITSIRIEDSQKAVKCLNGFYDWMMKGVDTTYTVYIGRDLVYEDNSRSPFVNAKSATFGADVTTINKHMFHDAKNLTDVFISNGVTTIGEEAFRNAGSNEDVAEMKVTMGENVTEIGPTAFYSATHLKALTLPTGLKVVSNEVLAYTAVNSVTIPAAVDSISASPFYGAPITSIRIEDSQKAVKCLNGFYDWMMKGVNTTYDVYVGRDFVSNDESRSPFINAKSVTFGPNATTVNKRMFYDAQKVESVTIGDGMKTIGAEAFRNNGRADGIEELTVVMGKNVTEIGDYAFLGAKNLKSITLPAGLKVVCHSILEGTAISAVTIPAAVDSIGANPFYGAPITNIRIEDNEKPVKCINGFYDWMMRGVNTEYSVYMGRDIDYTDTSRSPFANATSVTFGKNVSTLKANQLNTSKLMTVNAPWTTPIPIVVSAFNNTTYQNATLWIPGGTKPAYQEADGWKNFMHIETSSYVVSIESTKGGSLAVGELSVSNGEKAETTIEGASEVTFVVTPAEGYELASLTLNGAPVTVTANNTYTIPSLMEDVAMVATFTPIVYQIVYNLEGGIAQNPATYTIESETFTLTNPTREHYIFTGWTGTGLEEATMAVTIEKGSMGNREYKATWTPVEYTISYDLDGGVLPQEYPTVYTIEHDDITLVNPTKEHYDFIGWTGTGLGETPVKTVVIAKGSFGNREYKANWEAKTYIVTIQGNGATADNYTPKYGERVVLTLMDDPEATLVSLTVNGVDVTSQVVNNQYVIERVEGDIFVEVVFRSIYEYIRMAGTMTTFSCPQDLDFTGSDLKAYIAAGYNKQDNEVLLVRVYDVPAGTGLVLKGNEEQTYKVLYAESQSYYVNLLKAQLTAGTVEATSGDKSNFLLNRSENNEYSFYAPDQPVMLAGQKAYLQVPTSFITTEARIVKIAFAEDETDGIERFEMFGNAESEGVYNLAGQRVQKAGRGVFIKNGKKIVNK